MKTFFYQNPEKFVEDHSYIGEAGLNDTTLRLLHYPKIPEGAEVVPGQVRCGEHSDYGSITLLFQDDVGGLEVGELCRELCILLYKLVRTLF